MLDGLSLRMPIADTPDVLVINVAASVEVRSHTTDGDDYRFQFVLRLGADRWALHPVPCETAPAPAPNPAVSTHIDCFHVHEAIREATLDIEIVGLKTRAIAHLGNSVFDMVQKWPF